MIPNVWTSAVLVLAIFRATRLLGWDSMPILERLRALASGETVVTRGSSNARMNLTNESVTTSHSYRRLWIEELLSCPFCLGLWLSGAFYAAWVFAPQPTLYASFPLALSSVVGLIAKNWDP